MITCPACDKFLTNSALNCPCGWERNSRASARNYFDAPKPASACGNCGGELGAWTSSPKGRVCNPCWRGYMNGAWPS